MTMPLGEQFARAIAAKDRDALLAVLAPSVDFRALTPGRSWEADTATALVDDVILGHWFEPSDRIDGIEQIEHDVMVDTERVGYRLRVTNADGVSLVEQQAYLRGDDDGIAWLRIVCSGFRPIATPR